MSLFVDFKDFLKEDFSQVFSESFQYLVDNLEMNDEYEMGLRGVQIISDIDLEIIFKVTLTSFRRFLPHDSCFSMF